MYKIKRFSLVSKIKSGWSKLGPKGKIAVGSALTAAGLYGSKKAYDNKDKIKESSKKVSEYLKYAKDNPKEAASEVSNKVINYIKKNPDEAIVLGGSYAVPGVLAAKLKKAGKGKAAGLVASTALLPIGESYVAAKKAYQLKNKNKNERN